MSGTGLLCGSGGGGCDGEWQAGPQFGVVIEEGVLSLFTPKSRPLWPRITPLCSDASQAPQSAWELSLPRSSSRSASRSALWLQGQHHFSMMQAVCPLGQGYRWLAGPAQCTHPQPPADSRQPSPCANVWGGV